MYIPDGSSISKQTNPKSSVIYKSSFQIDKNTITQKNIAIC